MLIIVLNHTPLCLITAITLFVVSRRSFILSADCLALGQRLHSHQPLAFMCCCPNSILMSCKSNPLLVALKSFVPVAKSKRMHSCLKAKFSSNFTSEIHHHNLDISDIVGSPVTAMDIHILTRFATC